MKQEKTTITMEQKRNNHKKANIGKAGLVRMRWYLKDELIAISQYEKLKPIENESDITAPLDFLIDFYWSKQK